MQIKYNFLKLLINIVNICRFLSSSHKRDIVIIFSSTINTASQNFLFFIMLLIYIYYRLLLFNHK